MAKHSTDAEIIEALGVDALTDAGYSEGAVKKWRQKKRGIPWRERARIAELAATKRVKLPADFLQEQRRGA